MKTKAKTKTKTKTKKPSTRFFYRRSYVSDTWHFCGNCSRWPNWDFEVHQKKPKTGEFCNECRGKVKNNKCKKVVGHGD